MWRPLTVLQVQSLHPSFLMPTYYKPQGEMCFILYAAFKFSESYLPHNATFLSLTNDTKSSAQTDAAISLQGCMRKTKIKGTCTGPKPYLK